VECGFLKTPPFLKPSRDGNLILSKRRGELIKRTLELAAKGNLIKNYP
jgi:hypothetical protein